MPRESLMSRDSNDLNHLSGRARRSRKRNIRKQAQEERYRTEFPLFYIPALLYEIFYIHRYTPLEQLLTIIRHVERCSYFSLDTESVGVSQSAMLLQISTISSGFPFFIILVCLNHLPAIELELFSKIKDLFCCLFRGGNTIYLWGPSSNELEWVLPYKLFCLPLQCELVDLQSEFRYWFESVDTYCENCRPTNDIQLFRGATLFCPCQVVPYSDESKRWSLQNAVLCTSDSYLDKTMTRSPWNIIIDPIYSSLPIKQLEGMIRYAIYDVLALTYLHKPILARWSHAKLRMTSIRDFLQGEPVNLIDPYLNYGRGGQVQGANQVQESEGQNGEVNDVEDEPLIISTDENENFNHELSSKRKTSTRSSEARLYRNHRRNIRRRRIRYVNHIKRFCYRRYSSYRIRLVLKQLGVDFVHIRVAGHQVIIGMKNRHQRDYFDDKLPLNIFDRDHFFSIHHDR